MIEALDHLGNRKNRICITHQTGEADYEATRLSYEVKGFSADVRPFIEDVPRHYRKASLIICRSGATTLAEITASGKVSILIPFPFATHNHQEHNARVIEAANAGELILDNELSGKRLAESIAQAMDEPEEMKKMEENSYQIGNRDATEKVRQICIELMGDARRAAGNEKEPKGNYVLSCF
jgi:UDP-N-acetylglucosamine--N-acetylmuramyl-(pentapeptide) pyrophosphoryl-undecaprenol N-acetylglucosamine transferase